MAGAGAAAVPAIISAIRAVAGPSCSAAVAQSSLVTKRTGWLSTKPVVPVAVTTCVIPYFAYIATAVAHGVGLSAMAKTVPSSIAT